MISNFIKILSKNGQLKMQKEILQKFEAVFNRKNGIVVAEVKSCEKLDGKLVDELTGYIREKYVAKEVVMKNIVDEKIRGGMIVKVGDEIFDASVRGKLKKMQNILAS